MTLKSPRVKTTRLSLPVGESGQEPENAEPGTLGFATDTDQVRVQTSGGWVDVCDCETPLSRPPTSPAPNFSDDFDSLESLNNYTLWNRTAGVNMTRVGDVIFTSNTLTSSQFRASMYGGRFYLQLPRGVYIIFLYRAVTPGDQMYTAHIAPQVAGVQPAGATGVACSAIVTADATGRPDQFNFAILGNNQADAKWHSITRIASTIVNDTARDYDIPVAVATADQFIGTTRTSWVYNLDDGRAMRFETGVAFTPVRKWFGFTFTTTARIDDSIYSLYFLRELPAPTSWWVSTAPGSSGGGGGGGGGSGTITEIDAGPGIAVAGGTGPVVTVSADLAAGTNVTLTGTHPIVISASGGGGTLAGDANGPVGANTVNAIHETSGPTQLTIGNINNFQLLQRVGSTVVGTAYPPTTLVGDVNGPMTSNQVNAIHETSGPTTLTLGAISDGQILQRVGTTVVGSAGSLSTGNPYLDPPAVPNAFDDEFDSGSADLAVRGWQIWDSVVGGVLTRAGDIDIWSSTALENPPVSGTYRSSIVGSYLLLQLPVGGRSVSITRAFTPGTSGTVYGRIQGHFERGIAVADITNAGIFVEDNNTAANRVNVGVTQNVTPIPVRVVGAIKAGVYNTLTFANLSSNTTNDVDIVGLRYCGTATYYDVGLSTGGFPVTMAPVGGFVTNTPNVNLMTRAGAVFDRGATTTNSLNILAIDFLRFVPGDDWIAHAPKPVLWNVNASIPVAADITTKLAPLHWWRADNTVQTGGLVDTIVDNGSVAKDFTQTGAARCPTAVDGNGNTYLAFDGVTDFYQAGAVADWINYNDGTPFTLAMVVGRAALATAIEEVIGTGGANSNNTGFAAWLRYASSADQGFAFTVARATGGQYVCYVTDIDTSLGTKLVVFRMAGNLTIAALGGVSPAPDQTEMRNGGVLRAISARNATNSFNGVNPGSTLTLARAANASIEFSSTRIYEIVLTTGSWTDNQVRFYEQYAGSKYAIPSLVPTATNVSAAPYVSALINTYSPKSAPVAADQIYIADSGASNAITRATLSSAGAPAVYSFFPYLKPHPAQDAASDEFDSGSADLATRGWGIRNVSTGVNATRSGDINPLSFGANPATNTYLSTIIGSQLLLQLPSDGNGYYVYKAFTPNATGGYVWCRVTSFASKLFSAASNQLSDVATFLCGTSGGFPSTAQNYIMTGLRQRTDYSQHYLRNQSAGAATELSANSGAIANYIAVGQIYPIRGIKYDIPANRKVTAFHLTEPGDLEVISGTPTTSNVPVMSTITYAGVFFSLSTVDAATQPIMSIDFIRILNSAAGWIIT